MQPVTLTIPCLELTLVVPTGPSANARLRSGRFITKKYRAWRLQAAWEVKTQMGRTDGFSEPFDIEIEIPWGRMDVDNHLKCLMDMLKMAGAIQDDRLARRITIEPKDRTGVWMRLTPARVPHKPDVLITISDASV